MPEDLEELLRADHRRIELLVDLAMRADPTTVRPMVDSLGAELLDHCQREADVVYPAVRSLLGDDLEDHALDEHQGLHETLVALDDATVGTPAFHALLRSLKADAVDHATEEEKEILPMLRARMADERWSRLGDQFQQLTAQQAGPDNRVAGR